LFKGNHFQFAGHDESVVSLGSKMPWTH